LTEFPPETYDADPLQWIAVGIAALGFGALETLSAEHSRFEHALIDQVASRSVVLGTATRFGLEFLQALLTLGWVEHAIVGTHARAREEAVAATGIKGHAHSDATLLEVCANEILKRRKELGLGQHVRSARGVRLRSLIEVIAGTGAE
jgi:predicted RNA binding protein YcfA (HicA-like mRNA interferase family)